MRTEYIKTAKAPSAIGVKGADSTEYDKTSRFFELGYHQVVQLIRNKSDIFIDNLPRTPGVSMIGAIRCRPIHGTPTDTTAYPLNPNIRQYPAEGELVRVGSIAEGKTLFYEIVNLRNNPNFNQYDREFSTTNAVDLTNSATGDERVDKPLTSSKFFKGGKIPLLAPLSSDTIIQSRFGSAMRMTDITAGTGQSGYNPSVIISNNIAFRPSALLQENANEDGSNIMMLSGPADVGLAPSAQVRFFQGTKAGGFKTGFERTTSLRKSIKYLEGTTTPINPYNQDVKRFNRFTYPPTLTGDQIIVSSDRVVLNSKKNETLIFSEGPIGMFTSQKLSIDSTLGVDISTPRSSFRVTSDELYLNSMNIHLAGEGQRHEPAILGNALLTFLEATFGAIFEYLSTDVAFKKSMEAAGSGVAGAGRSAENVVEFLRTFTFDDNGGVRLNPKRLEEILSDKVFIGANNHNPTFE